MNNGDWKHLKLTRTNRVLEISFETDNKINALTTAVMRELQDIAVEAAFHKDKGVTL